MWEIDPILDFDHALSKRLMPAACRSDPDQKHAGVLSRAEYVARMKEELDEWNGEMDALRARAHEAREDAMVKYRAAQRIARQASERRGETGGYQGSNRRLLGGAESRN